MDSTKKRKVSVNDQLSKRLDKLEKRITKIEKKRKMKTQLSKVNSD